MEDKRKVKVSQSTVNYKLISGLQVPTAISLNVNGTQIIVVIPDNKEMHHQILYRDRVDGKWTIRKETN